MGVVVDHVTSGALQCLITKRGKDIALPGVSRTKEMDSCIEKIVQLCEECHGLIFYLLRISWLAGKISQVWHRCANNREEHSITFMMRMAKFENGMIYMMAKS